MIKACRHCGAEFELRPGKPGLVDECPSCVADDVPLAGGNMVWDHKTAPYIEVKTLREAKTFANKGRRGYGRMLL